MHEMMNLGLAKQHREELLREVEVNRLANRLWAARKRRDDRTSLLARELKRGAGLLLKFLRTTLNGVS